MATFAAAAETQCNQIVPAQRLLTFYWCSAQTQRRALGFDDGDKFGSTGVGSILTMCSSQGKVVRIFFVSALNDDSEKVVYPLKLRSKLDTFQRFMECYILCKVEHGKSRVVDQISGEGSEHTCKTFKLNQRPAIGHTRQASSGAWRKSVGPEKSLSLRRVSWRNLERNTNFSC